MVTDPAHRGIAFCGFDGLHQIEQLLRWKGHSLRLTLRLAVTPFNPAFHPPVSLFSFLCFVGMRGRPVHVMHPISVTVGPVEILKLGQVVALKILCPVVHGQDLNGARECECGDFNLVGELHRARPVVAGAVAPVWEHDLTPIAGNAGDAGGLDAIVERDEHLRLEPSARTARASNAICIYFFE